MRLLCSEHSSDENVVVVTTPTVNQTARHLAVKLVLHSGAQIGTNRTFEYRSNPVFTNIEPRSHLTV